MNTTSRFTSIDPQIDLAARMAYRRMERTAATLTVEDADPMRVSLFLARLAWPRLAAE